MAVNIYADADPATVFSLAGSMINPIRCSVNGQFGGVVINRYYVRSNDAAFVYSGVNITPVSTGGANVVNGTNDFSWKIIAQSLEPTENDWDNAIAGATVVIGHLNNVSTYLPFWLRIQVPREADVESYDKTVLRISATEVIAY